MQRLIPLLMLTTVALSSSNIILDLADSTQPLRGQEKDNTLLNYRNIMDKICERREINDEKSITLCKLIRMNNNLNTDNNEINKNILLLYDLINKENSYDGKGFRKEQWHNYPRQLDRLQKFLYERHKSYYGELDELEAGQESDDDGIINEDDTRFENTDFNDILSKDILIQHDNEDKHNVYDKTVATTNPLLILKIRLACLSLANQRVKEPLNNFKNEANKILTTDNTEQLNPKIAFLNKGSDGYSESLYNTIDKFEKQISNRQDQLKSIPSKKRIFSMWSRLQSFSPKGHELHNRRHLHAFYGLPGDGSGGIVSAETRALSRPQGSPLRWG